MVGGAVGRNRDRPATWGPTGDTGLCGAKFQYRNAADVGKLVAGEAAIGSAGHVKPSKVRCSCHATGTRECASSPAAYLW